MQAVVNNTQIQHNTLLNLAKTFASKEASRIGVTNVITTISHYNVIGDSFCKSIVDSVGRYEGEKILRETKEYLENAYKEELNNIYSNQIDKVHIS